MITNFFIKKTLKYLEPVKYHVLGNVTEGILFNHAAFLSHRKVTDLLNIPVLKTLDGGIYNET